MILENELCIIANDKKDAFLMWLDSVINSDYNIFNEECDNMQLKVLQQVREKYLEFKLTSVS